ncbi:hypothetical protein SAMN04490210_0178 [Pseudomonas sp. bs2935]|nr:hypothetical protein SAMN04490210_0178 [Pseudomonas sp. bs2935]
MLRLLFCSTGYAQAYLTMDSGWWRIAKDTFHGNGEMNSR